MAEKSPTPVPSSQIYTIARTMNNLINYGIRPPISLTMHPDQFKRLWKTATQEQDRQRRQGKNIPCSLVVRNGVRMIEAQFWLIMEG